MGSSNSGAVSSLSVPGSVILTGAYVGMRSSGEMLKITSWLAPETMDMGDPRRSRCFALNGAGDFLPWVTRYLSCIRT